MHSPHATWSVGKDMVSSSDTPCDAPTLELATYAGCTATCSMRLASSPRSKQALSAGRSLNYPGVSWAVSGWSAAKARRLEPRVGFRRVHSFPLSSHCDCLCARAAYIQQWYAALRASPLVLTSTSINRARSSKQRILTRLTHTPPSRPSRPSGTRAQPQFDSACRL